MLKNVGKIKLPRIVVHGPTIIIAKDVVVVGYKQQRRQSSSSLFAIETCSAKQCQIQAKVAQKLLLSRDLNAKRRLTLSLSL